MLTNLTYDEVRPQLEQLVDRFSASSRGVGSRGFVRLSQDEFRAGGPAGCAWCVQNGYGWPEDLERTEMAAMPRADASKGQRQGD